MSQMEETVISSDTNKVEESGVNNASDDIKKKRLDQLKKLKEKLSKGILLKEANYK